MRPDPPYNPFATYLRAPGPVYHLSRLRLILLDSEVLKIYLVTRHILHLAWCILWYVLYWLHAAYYSDLTGLVLQLAYQEVVKTHRDAVFRGIIHGVAA